MKILLVGGSGTIGQRILAEALKRGHTVTTVTRDPSRVPVQINVKAAQGGRSRPEELSRGGEGARRGGQRLLTRSGNPRRRWWTRPARRSPG